MTEQESFIRAICENPYDDTPRLIFADWLEERGNDPERAAFIRGQIELESLPEPAELTVGVYGPKQGSVDWNRVVCTACRELDEGECRYHQVKRTVDDLWWSFYPHTTPCRIPDWMCLFPEYSTEIFNQHHKKCTRACLPLGNPLGLPFTWTRGFAGSVDCWLEAWMQYGHEAVQRAPVTEVRVVNKQPIWSTGSLCSWHFRGVQQVSHEYFEIPCDLKEYWPSKFIDIPIYYEGDDAFDGLSQACVNYARALASLPFLVTS